MRRLIRSFFKLLKNDSATALTLLYQAVATLAHGIRDAALPERDSEGIAGVLTLPFQRFQGRIHS